LGGFPLGALALGPGTFGACPLGPDALGPPCGAVFGPHGRDPLDALDAQRSLGSDVAYLGGLVVRRQPELLLVETLAAAVRPCCSGKDQSAHEDGRDQPDSPCVSMHVSVHGASTVAKPLRLLRFHVEHRAPVTNRLVSRPAGAYRRSP
jgi:hypothetical protein